MNIPAARAEGESTALKAGQGESAQAALTSALVSLARLGRRTPCQGEERDLWFGSPSERLEVAAGCADGCPVLALCRAYGDEIGERWGVLGGLDREAPRQRMIAPFRPASAQVRTPSANAVLPNQVSA